MNISVTTKVRIGVKFALIASITIAGRAACAYSPLIHRNAVPGCIALGILGFLFWLAGGVTPQPIEKAGEKSPMASEQALVHHPLEFLRRIKSWGLILMLSAAAIAPFVVGYSRKSIVVSAPNPVAAVTNAPPMVFPSLSLQGITLRGEKSSALINGQVLFIGDGIGPARLIEIEGSQVTMEMQGQTEILALEE